MYPDFIIEQFEKLFESSVLNIELIECFLIGFPDIIEYDSYSYVHQIGKAGNLDLIKLLIHKYEFDIHAEEDQIFFICVREKHDDCVNFLMDECNCTFLSLDYYKDLTGFPYDNVKYYHILRK